MLTHQQIWSAIDALAEREGITASALARKSGLDPTTFNKSKRATTDGRLRWPSTESVAKCLAATDTTIEDFVELMVPENERPRRSIPLIDLARASHKDAFDDDGLPAGEGWHESDLPAIADGETYALDVSSDDLLPLYRSGDRLIISAAAIPRSGDRVVLKTRQGVLHIGALKHVSDTSLELKAPQTSAPDQVIEMDDIAWMSRIIWVSQ
ncbi:MULTISPECIES: helix-turn-helix transcriptional regulator [unclassified Beijerinckia]|uniref:S24 family peptidase n=1 Tax=unclassified Beijerinckia TaxID=2638183 RepID=UPI0008947AE1|nr:MULTISPECIES: helix-turn-helix transcriptional regulator [unclassified Beijerinckia]MDH7796660.1 phage repressor protein C with HTH and peptisase S24 domain [Beijerinckia sp. GAS462]SEC54568.1 Phage repressor protein C, contains Cro/C1-type HTH and peptisase s24 domains [Beijerinckia sp. 28-YEA-48]